MTPYLSLFHLYVVQSLEIISKPKLIEQVYYDKTWSFGTFSVSFKVSWEKVRDEMINEKGLDSTVADRIGEFVKLKGDEKILEKLETNEDFIANEKAKDGLKELKKIAQWSKILEFAENVSHVGNQK